MVRVIGSRVFMPYKYVAGGVWVDLGDPSERNPAKQTFTYIPNDTLIPEHYHIPKLLEIIKANPDHPQVEMRVESRTARHIMKNNGVEDAVIRAMSRERMKEPGIILFRQDGTQTLIDGNNRYVKRWKRGFRSMLFYKFDEETVKPAMLELPREFAYSVVGR